MQHQPLSKSLAEILTESAAPGGLSLNLLLERTEGRSLYLLIIVLCLPFMVPMSIPGLSTIMGSVIIWLAIRQVLGKPPRLPKTIGTRKLPPAVQRRVVGGSLRFLRLLEKVIRPRRTQWLSWRWVTNANSLLLAFLGFLLALPLPSPPFFFSNSIPSYAIVVMAVSMMEEDGVTIWLGYALVLFNIIFFSLIGGAAVELFERLWKTLSHSIFGAIL